MDMMGMVVRRATLNERGALRSLVLAGAGIAGTLAALVAMNPAEQVAAAEQSACVYEHRVLLTAVEADHALNSLYAAPAGDDGLDGVRAAGFLANQARYWRYTGLGPDGHPTFAPRTEKVCDSGAAAKFMTTIERLDPSTSTTAP